MHQVFHYFRPITRGGHQKRVLISTFIITSLVATLPRAPPESDPAPLWLKLGFQAVDTRLQKSMEKIQASLLTLDGQTQPKIKGCSLLHV